MGRLFRSLRCAVPQQCLQGCRSPICGVRKRGSDRSTLLVGEQHGKFSFLSIPGWAGNTNTHSWRSRAQLRAQMVPTCPPQPFLLLKKPSEGETLDPRSDLTRSPTADFVNSLSDVGPLSLSWCSTPISYQQTDWQVPSSINILWFSCLYCSGLLVVSRKG